MWIRKELKDIAKVSFKRNYWKTVLSSLLYVFFVYGTAFAGGICFSFDDVVYDSPDTLAIFVPLLAIIGAFVAVILAVAVVFFVSVCLANPFSVGFHRYTVNAIRGNGYVADLCSGFDVSYKRNVKVMFYYDLYIILWSLLFLIPGIVKSYEYRMLPYILADNPEIEKDEAFKLSKEMMKGNKWKMFVLDLSFILWNILGGMTFGIVNIFWTYPYRFLTSAALYDNLKNNI